MADAIRFTGLTSGLDTESIVKALVATDKSKVDNLKKEEMLMELKQEEWKKMNNTLMDFYTDTVGTLRHQGSFDSKIITNTNEDSLTIHEGSNIPDGTHEIIIGQLASSAQLKTDQIYKVDPDTHMPTDEPELVTKDTKLSETSSYMSTQGDDATYTIKIGEEEVEILGSDTMEDIANKIKEVDDSLNVNFDQGRFMISNKETGEFDIDISADATVGEYDNSDVLKALFGEGNLTDNEDGTYNVKFNKGTNAHYEYNGNDYESTSNSVTVNGISMTFKQTTGAYSEEDGVTATDGDSKILVSSEQDQDAIYETIVSFIEDYNTLLEDLNSKIDMPGSDDYMPLTDEEMAEMSDYEIELWNKKIEENIFADDPALQDFVDTLRGALGSNEDLISMGITTGNWKEQGKLHIDEEKLKEAISENADKIIEAFAGGTDADGNETEGVMDELYTKFSDQIATTTLNSFGSFYNDKVIDEKLRNIATDIIKYQDRYETREDYYFSKFNAMEQMMNEWNSQSAVFASA
ncbi:hypothetical protein AN640_06020 [Candidatus Epulonipiscium fishelsonii]|uniref:Uncharacterized protein n=1 Tax=Candidatus Epulonipiscium fishelsonii TaxID=77094 RepID=A0ACC8XHY4_9FIRM|nr:hypothetical protein AN640_06020 [Epulopiscium sp. SCG-D08WGA-EpuloA1]OON94848.1 MAG: hypothetical protein ATN32_01395 [Epulopiscium sp. AS2M-Bin002]